MCKPQRTQRAPPTEADQRRRAGSEAGGAEGGTGKAGVEVKSLETSQRLWIQKEEEKIRCPPPLPVAHSGQTASFGGGVGDESSVVTLCVVIRV